MDHLRCPFQPCTWHLKRPAPPLTDEQATAWADTIADHMRHHTPTQQQHAA